MKMNELIQIHVPLGQQQVDGLRTWSSELDEVLAQNGWPNASLGSELVKRARLAVDYAEDVANGYRGFGHDSISVQRTRDNTEYITALATVNQEPVGVMTFFIDTQHKEIELDIIAAHPLSILRQYPNVVHVGSRLFAYLVDLANNNGCSIVVTATQNEWKFYQKMGMVEDERHRRAHSRVYRAAYRRKVSSRYAVGTV